MKMEDSNKMIAEFCVINITPVGLRRNVMQKSYFVDELKYDTSWDWLMPVWIKILQWGMQEYGIQWRQSIDQDCVSIITPNNLIYIQYLDKKGELPIEAVYQAVVQFIQWYNTNH